MKRKEGKHGPTEKSNHKGGEKDEEKNKGPTRQPENRQKMAIVTSRLSVITLSLIVGQRKCMV